VANEFIEWNLRDGTVLKLYQCWPVDTRSYEWMRWGFV